MTLSASHTSGNDGTTSLLMNSKRDCAFGVFPSLLAGWMIKNKEQRRSNPYAYFNDTAARWRSIPLSFLLLVFVLGFQTDSQGGEDGDQIRFNVASDRVIR